MKPATLTVPEASRLLGISRNAAYAAAARGELPVIRIGRRVLVPTQRLLQMLGAASAPVAYVAADKLAGVAAGEVNGAAG